MQYSKHQAAAAGLVQRRWWRMRRKDVDVQNGHGKLYIRDLSYLFCDSSIEMGQFSRQSIDRSAHRL